MSSRIDNYLYSGRDYYHILGVSHKASIDDIKKAYRKLALKYHPDIIQNNRNNISNSNNISNNNIHISSNTFHEITQAYNILLDYDKRSMYDLFNQTDDWEIYYPSYVWHSSPENIEHSKHIKRHSHTNMFRHTNSTKLQSDTYIAKPSLFWRRRTL